MVTEDPPLETRARLEALLGARPLSWASVQGGYTPTARWRVSFSDFSVFVKVATNLPTAELLRREAATYRALTGSFMPDFIGWEDHETRPMLVIEDLSGALWPPPWTRSLVDRTLQSLKQMHETQAEVPPFGAVHTHHIGGWQAVSEDPQPLLALGVVSHGWLDKHLPALLEAEAACRTDGNTLAHFDIRSDNLCRTETGVVLVDWAEACLANPKLDTGFWLPSLAFEGGPQPEDILPSEPEIAAWVSGFFAARAGLAPVPGGPQVRRVQQEQLSTALPWVRRALGGR